MNNNLDKFREWKTDREREIEREREREKREREKRETHILKENTRDR
jgi:hypothetical protein